MHRIFNNTLKSIEEDNKRMEQDLKRWDNINKHIKEASKILKKSLNKQGVKNEIK